MAVTFLSDLVSSTELILAPDHPLLLRAPDAIVGMEGNVCAIFEPQSIEEQNPAHLVARLVATRYALPRSTRAILILTRSQETRFASVEKHFALVTNRSDRNLRTFLRSAGDFGRSKPMDPYEMRRVSKNFDIAMEVARFAFFLNRREVSTAAVDGQVSKKPSTRRISMEDLHYQPRNRLVVNGVETSVLSSRTRAGLLRQVNSMLTGNVLSSFTLVDGVPHANAFAATQIGVAEAAEKVLDPTSKAIYASALLSTALIGPKDPSVVEATIARFADRLQQHPEALQK